MDDDLVLPVLDALRACLCTQLDGSPGGPVCFCSLMPGQRVPADFCTCNGTGGACGMAWTRAGRIYPYKVFPQQDLSLQKCVAPLAGVVELGVYRCIPSQGTNGAPPTPVAQTEATRVQMGDFNALWRAVRCCADDDGVLKDRMVSLGAYEPRSGGGCGGGVLTVTVQLGRVR